MIYYGIVLAGILISLLIFISDIEGTEKVVFIGAFMAMMMFSLNLYDKGEKKSINESKVEELVVEDEISLLKLELRLLKLEKEGKS